MILGSRELEILIKHDPPIIDPYCEKLIEGSGLEVRIWKLASLEGFGRLDEDMKSRRTPNLNDLEPDKDEYWNLEPTVMYSMTTLEAVNLPNDLSGLITPRSTLQRSGVGLFVANISPGYTGTLTFGICNFHNLDYKLKRGARVAFIQFAELKDQDPEACYKGQWQGGRRSCPEEELQR